MNKTLTVCALLVASLFAANGQAQSLEFRPYIGADVVLWDFDFNDIATFNAAGTRLRAGLSLTRHLGIEVHGGFGGSDSAPIALEPEPVSHGIELDRFLAVFVRGDLSLTRRINAYALLGYADVEATSHFTVGTTTAHISDNDDGFSFGGGLEVELRPWLAANVDYVRYLHDSQYTFSGLSVGLKLTFSRF
jgi:opacity protein-like surface antigen